MKNGKKRPAEAGLSGSVVERLAKDCSAIARRARHRTHNATSCCRPGSYRMIYPWLSWASTRLLPRTASIANRARASRSIGSRIVSRSRWLELTPELALEKGDNVDEFDRRVDESCADATCKDERNSPVARFLVVGHVCDKGRSG